MFVKKYNREVWQGKHVMKQMELAYSATPVWKDGEAMTTTSRKCDDIHAVQAIIDAARDAAVDYREENPDAPNQEVRDVAIAVINEALQDKRGGIGFLLRMFAEIDARRGVSKLTYARCDGASYAEKLKFLLANLSIPYLQSSLATFYFGLGRFSRNGTTGGLSNHPYYPQVEGYPSPARIQRLIEKGADSLTEIIKALKKHAAEDTRLMKQWKKDKQKVRPRSSSVCIRTKLATRR